MNYHRDEVQMLKKEKDELEATLTMKTQDVRKNLTNSLYKVSQFDDRWKRR